MCDPEGQRSDDPWRALVNVPWLAHWSLIVVKLEDG
jgi:hypothetical protein